MLDLAEPAADAAGPAVDAPGIAASDCAVSDSAACALAARIADYRRGQAVVDFANRGVPIPEIAARLGIPAAEARARLREALARTLPESPAVFAALQMSRLNEALLVAWSAMGEMGLEAVDRVLRIVRALDRLHAAAMPLAAADAADAAEPKPLAAPWVGRRPAAPGARDALPPGEGGGSRPDRPARDKRNQTAPQATEKAQNRSQTRDPAPAAEAVAPLSGAQALDREPGDLSKLPGVMVDALADPATALFAKRADAREFAPAPNLAAIRLGGASALALAAAGA